MVDIPKGVQTSKLTKKQSFVVAIVVIAVAGIGYVVPKLFEKTGPSTVNSSNSGTETNTGVSNKGIDSRSGSVTVQGNNSTVINNSSINAKP